LKNNSNINGSSKDRGVVSHAFGSNPSGSGASHHGDGHSAIATCIPTVACTSLHGHGAAEYTRLSSISSSPQSSEPTSAHFFRSHSSHSSFSSIVATSPSRPRVPTHRSARSPSPQSRSRSKSTSSLSTRDESHSSGSPLARTRKRSSPDIPAFSVSEVVNNFILRRPSLTRHQRHHASARSMSRIILPPAAGEVRGTSLRRAGSVGSRQRGHVDPTPAPGSSGQNRDSRGSGSTERPLSTATVLAANAGSPVEALTFRELGTTQRPAWTSQEKEDKWHDLLERSAQAGGTLHLDAGDTQLASDNIRFSLSTFNSETSRSE